MQVPSGESFFSRDAKSQSLGSEGIVAEILYKVAGRSHSLGRWRSISSDRGKDPKHPAGPIFFEQYHNILSPDELAMQVLGFSVIDRTSCRNFIKNRLC